MTAPTAARDSDRGMNRPAGIHRDGGHAVFGIPGWISVRPLAPAAVPGSRWPSHVVEFDGRFPGESQGRGWGVRRRNGGSRRYLRLDFRNEFQIVNHGFSSLRANALNAFNALRGGIVDIGRLGRKVVPFFCRPPVGLDFLFPSQLCFFQQPKRQGNFLACPISLKNLFSICFE